MGHYRTVRTDTEGAIEPVLERRAWEARNRPNCDPIAAEPSWRAYLRELLEPELQEFNCSLGPEVLPPISG
jgi:hypothetical protein